MQNGFGLFSNFKIILFSWKYHISVLRLALEQAERNNRKSKIETTWFSVWSLI